MRMFPFFAAAAVLAGCATSPGPVDGPVAQTETPRSIEGLRLAGSFSAGGITVMPVLRTEPPKEDQEVTTLAEAQKAGTVEIRELPDSQVNSLLVINHGEKPLLLLAGDLLLGGKQDRIVAKDTLVPPGKAMQVEAFCVEHGRWSGSDSKFEYSGGVVPQSVKNAAARSSQQEVWDRVAKFRTNAGPVAEFGQGTTVRDAVQAPEIEAAVKDALRELRGQLAQMRDAVGFVVARNGKVVAVELFGSPQLFRQAQEAVLQSYLADAAVAPAEAPKRLAGGEAESALKRALDARKGGKADGMAVTQVEGRAGAAGLPLHGSYGFEEGGR